MSVGMEPGFLLVVNKNMNFRLPGMGTFKNNSSLGANIASMRVSNFRGLGSEVFA